MKTEEFFNSLDLTIDIFNYINVDEIKELGSFNSLLERLEEEGAFEIYITYYSQAIKYLSVHDASLCESLSIAEEFGYELSSLNSEVLASLLASREAKDDFLEFENEIEEFYDNL